MSTYATSAAGPDTVVNNNNTFSARSILAGTDPQSNILDSTWAKQAFLVNQNDLDPVDVQNRGYSTAVLKFTDTTLGGNYAVNAKPQFTRYADPRAQGRKQGRNETRIGSINGNLGMGRYYSEAIDDNAQLIHMRFGVAQFNSLTTFFTGFYNQSAGRLARTGRSGKGFFFGVGETLGIIAQIVVWPLIAVQAFGRVARFFLQKPTSKYYYLKPAMFVYWASVNSMVNKIAVGRGLFPVRFADEGTQSVGQSYKIDQEGLENLHRLMPDVFSADGGYDIYAVANKAQRLKIYNDQRIFENFNNESDSDFFSFVKGESATKVINPPGEHTLRNAFQNFLKSSSNLPSTNDGAEQDIKNTPDKEGYFDYLKAELDDGGAFVTMRVDYTGPVQESFANSKRPSDISGKVNSIMSQRRSSNYSFAGGNIDDSVIGKTVGGILGAAGNVVAGALDSLSFGGLVSLAGGAFVDFPDHWESSQATLPRSSYTMQLVSPYGNVVSQMQNIYIPLCMLLAMALPLSTGRQSYTSPFLLELYDKGRHQTRLGMVDALSITRGTTNLGFNKSGHAMGVDVTFSVVDMSSVMHMQMSKGLDFVGGDDGVFDDETVFSDYMNTLSSLGLHEQFHVIPKLRLALARKQRALESLTSPAAWAAFTKNETPIGMLEVFFKGTAR
jgi:hypothetical protein